MHGIETLKERIRNGEKVIGASVRMWATKSDIDQTLSVADYDFLAVDAQHTDTQVPGCTVGGSHRAPEQNPPRHEHHKSMPAGIAQPPPVTGQSCRARHETPRAPTRVRHPRPLPTTPLDRQHNPDRVFATHQPVRIRNSVIDTLLSGLDT